MGDAKSNWVPKTGLGRKVMNGEITSIDEIFDKGLIIREPEIVEVLVPELETYLIRTGGMPGKGGGKSRTSVRVTTRMHKSGRRRTLHALVIAGNCNGLLGMGYATGEDAQRAIQKAERQAKLHMVPIRRGCGSWECGCGGTHSLPFKVKGRSGSISVELLPAPIGLGLCVAHEMKKLMRFAGITDVWARSFGNTASRLNFARATFEALKSVNTGTEDSEDGAKPDVAKPKEQEAKKEEKPKEEPAKKEEKAPVKEAKPAEEKKKDDVVKEETPKKEPVKEKAKPEVAEKKTEPAKPKEKAEKKTEAPAAKKEEKPVEAEKKADPKSSEASVVVDEKEKPDTGKDGEEVESKPKE
ncbi:MAG: 30S ribosomal protein S5 [Hyphomicrobiaceae bacterium]|nr:30S ribosomal protein S5 [Hyphomicrobiaceae bacterium]